MTDHTESRLPDQLADKTLRRVLVAAGASADDKLPLDAALRAGLNSLLEEAGADGSPRDVDEPLSDVALAVITADDKLNGLIERARHSAPPRDFGLDPIQLLNSASLALVVMSLYLDFERDKAGKVSIKFGVKPISEAVKSKLLDLIGVLTRKLPKD